MSDTAIFFVLFTASVLLIAMAIRRSGWMGRPIKSLAPWHLGIIRKYVLYYEGLDTAGRERFERTVATFLFRKEWRAVGMELEEEMKVMIAASAAQVLNGLPEVSLAHFTTIVVYPNAYRAGRGDRWHQGEVRPQQGTVAISWKHFLQGYAKSSDGRNVALHEMAHALWFEDIIPNAEQGFFPEEEKRRWNTKADKVISAIRAGRETFFRAYAGTDAQEFFAVSVEYFFEQPTAFKAAHPELYLLLCRLLRQDPLGTTLAVGADAP